VFTPSIVRSAATETVYIVEDDYGHVGRSFRETDATKADRETTLQDLLAGQYNDPVRVVAFNTREGWSRDVSHESALELQRRADLERRELAGTLANFVENYTYPPRQLAFRLA
jgi:hypothetical protein